MSPPETDALNDEPTALYWIYATRRRLLYIGVGWNPVLRWVDHSGKPWWSEVDHIKVDWFPNRVAAEAAERAAIQRYQPPQNTTHRATLIPIEFSELLRHLRADRGISLSELGRRASYSLGYIWDLENARRRPKPAVAAALDDALGANGALVALAPALSRKL
jgi:helix-turn-helix protein